jgi:hypothetical protein
MPEKLLPYMIYRSKDDLVGSYYQDILEYYIDKKNILLVTDPDLMSDPAFYTDILKQITPIGIDCTTILILPAGPMDLKSEIETNFSGFSMEKVLDYRVVLPVGDNRFKPIDFIDLIMPEEGFFSKKHIDDHFLCTFRGDEDWRSILSSPIVNKTWSQKSVTEKLSQKLFGDHATGMDLNNVLYLSLSSLEEFEFEPLIASMDKEMGSFERVVVP